MNTPPIQISEEARNCAEEIHRLIPYKIVRSISREAQIIQLSINQATEKLRNEIQQWIASRIEMADDFDKLTKENEEFRKDNLKWKSILCVDAAMTCGPYLLRENQTLSARIKSLENELARLNGQMVSYCECGGVKK